MIGRTIPIVLGIVGGGAGGYLGIVDEPEDRPAVSIKASEDAAPVAVPIDLRAQRLAARKAKVAYEMARLNRELAEIAVEEYVDVSYPRERAAVEGEVKLAEADLSRAEERAGWAERMFKKGYVARSQLVSEEQGLQKAMFGLEQAQGKRTVLDEFTKEKTVKELESAVEKARADEFAREAIWKLEEAKEDQMRRQLRRSGRARESS